MNDALRKKSLGGFIWKLFERIGSQLISLIIQIVLARILIPSDYGVIGYLTLFISLMDVFLKSGFTTALVQKKEIDDTDKSTVFFSNIILSVVLYLIMYIIAPSVASYYSEPSLISIMRALTLTMVIGALSSVHETLMIRDLEFKKIFIRGLANNIINGLVGIYLALHGFGVWALVYGRLAGVTIGVLIMWGTVKWRPKFRFSISKLGGLFSFSSGILLTNLMETFFHNIYSLIIGKLYSSSDLGYYQRGQNFPQTIMGAVDGSMTEVMYPTLSKLQNNIALLKSALRRSMKLSMFVCLPIIVGLFTVAEPLTLILLKEKWMPSVPYMKVMCIITLFWPLAGRMNALKAIGKSKVTFIISLCTNFSYLIFVVILADYGPFYIMIASVFSNIIGLGITSIYVNKFIGYSFVELIKDIWKIFVLALFMGTCTYLVSFISDNMYIVLVLQICVGIVIYILGAYLMRIDSFSYILNMLTKRKINNNV